MMISQKDFKAHVESFCKKAEQSKYESVAPRANKLCAELRTCSTKISDSDAAKWDKKLDNVSSVYGTCVEAGGSQSKCSSFFEKADKLMNECRRL